jgi:alcohol oxidase
MASDYDDWATVHENPGWSSKDLIPLMQKTETYQVGSGKPTHGYSGPLKVSYGGVYTNIGKQFLDVCAAYDKERGSTDDINSMMESTSINKYGRWEKWIDAESGKRSDVPHHFIYNAEHKNLTVLDGKRVKRVIFEGTRAVGVEYTNDIISKPGSDQTLEIANASKLVVLSAGAFGSPTILERSGLGAKRILEEVGVEPLVDLPGVGENYQDHNVIFVPYLAGEEADTLDAIFRGDKVEVEKCVALWTKEGKGLMAHNGLDAGIKLRPTPTELEELGPQFARQWAEYFADAPDKPVLWMGPVAAYLGDPSIASARKYYSMGYYTVR